MPRPSSALAGLLLAAALAGCGGASTDVAIEMATKKVDRATVGRALDEFRNACRPLFSRHAADVRAIRAVVSDEGSTQVRRFGWGVHLDLTVTLVRSPTTLPAPVDAEARFLIGGGTRPGVLAFSATAAALCGLKPATGRSTVFAAAPPLAELLPPWVATPTTEQVAAYRAEEARALSGDYQSQRNVAWCFVDGCTGVEPIDDVRACAWRKVILAAKHPKADASDRDNVTLDCDRALAPADVDVATAKAEELFRKIYKKDLPKAP